MENTRRRGGYGHEWKLASDSDSTTVGGSRWRRPQRGAGLPSVRISRPAFLVVLCLTIAFVASGAAREQQFEGRTLDEWIAQLGSDFQKRREAQKTLAKIGASAVPALVALIEKHDPRCGAAFEALGQMGPVARDALPAMLRVAEEKNWKTPEGWRWNVSPRQLVFSSLGKMSWASAQLIPLFRGVAANASEPVSIRTRATAALKGMGKDAIPVLRELSGSELDELREAAHYALYPLLKMEPKEYFAQVLEENPCDTNAAEYLGRTKGRYNIGRLDPLTERVKTALRERLRKSPDPEIAWTLVSIIQDQLSATGLQWAAPSDSYSSRSDRENPKESYATLAKVAELGFRHSEKDSDLWRRLGTGLAKLRLLQGDWAGMNAVLKRLGQKPIDRKMRPFLAAPPTDWKDLRKNWQRCDGKMRSGTSALIVKIEKGGKGLRGVHILLKEAPKPQRVFRTGWRVDTLFASPEPFERHLDSFGYRGQDRPLTRYGVSDESGVVRFSKLPAMKSKIEVLVPTSNFPEPGPGWELWMEVEPGKFQLASGRPGPNTVRSDSPLAVVELEEGKTAEYPPLVVRPKLTFNIHDFARADRESFVLTWSRVGSPSKARGISYALEMTLSAVAESPRHGSPPVLQSTKTTVRGDRWPVGEKGVGGLRLEPGNIYAFQINAFDAEGQLLARSPRVRVWVPWEHRASDPPIVNDDPRSSVPITHRKWWRGSSSYGDGKEENLRQQVERFLLEKRKAFEYEYVEMGKAWLDWRDGDRENARKQLLQLVAKLPAGNVARATSAWLIEQIDQGARCPKRLQFVAE